MRVGGSSAVNETRVQTASSSSSKPTPNRGLGHCCALVSGSSQRNCPLRTTSATPRQQSPENSCTKATWMTMSRLPAARLKCSQELLHRPNLHVSSSRHAAQLHEIETPGSQEPAPLPLSCSLCVCARACVAGCAHSLFVCEGESMIRHLPTMHGQENILTHATTPRCDTRSLRYIQSLACIRKT